ncbi:membrane attack complex component perforin [Diplodia corticola]|uniref:Membrane attack complex component perforin n=1 Tax=Diplodia corticola TaxID=236234 RepID=A0A1J9QTZ9_9PEZI|nr:membrane attack complex component perforin [Diplodia corticola]OJD31466.1 membrane attack complex component perforin [Diplodia corticola]
MSENKPQGEKAEESQPPTVDSILGGSHFLLRLLSKQGKRGASVSSAQLSEVAKKKSKKIPELPLGQLRDFGRDVSSKDCFCLDDDNETPVDDSMTLSDYLSYTSPTKEGTAATKILTIFFTRPLVRPKGSDRKQLGESQLAPVELPDADRAQVGRDDVAISEARKAAASLAARDYAAASANGDALHPADLTHKEWDVVVKNNYLVHGYVVDIKAKTITVARRPAFRIKRRPLESFLTYDASIETDETLAIPDFRIFDDSSVSVVEITSQEEQSLVENSFSAWGAKASAGGDALFFSAEGAAEAGGNSSSGSGKAQSKFESRMWASYNFPRVRVFLDEESLEPTKECKTLLEKIKAASEAKKTDEQIKLTESFGHKFGHVFATEAQLGGMLYSTRMSSSFASDSTSKKMDSMRVAVAASFSTSRFAAAASAEAKWGSDSASTSSETRKSDSLAWEAKGGDTLLCSDPPAWISTVKDYQNWRVMERAVPQRISDLIGKMEGSEMLGKFAPHPAGARSGASFTPR